ncbi:hypothetical protein B0H14DRAFT_677892 [Mycena olivaceomarginata]|nr:hypothetical protein B0H14DRAFT_677892 [Mycena olivaceomarginata]
MCSMVCIGSFSFVSATHVQFLPDSLPIPLHYSHCTFPPRLLLFSTFLFRSHHHHRYYFLLAASFISILAVPFRIRIRIFLPTILSFHSYLFCPWISRLPPRFASSWRPSFASPPLSLPPPTSPPCPPPFPFFPLCPFPSSSLSSPETFSCVSYQRPNASSEAPPSLSRSPSHCFVFCSRFFLPLSSPYTQQVLFFVLDTLYNHLAAGNL